MGLLYNVSFFTSEDRLTIDMKVPVNYSEKIRVVHLYFLRVENCDKNCPTRACPHINSQNCDRSDNIR